MRIESIPNIKIDPIRRPEPKRVSVLRFARNNFTYLIIGIIVIWSFWGNTISEHFQVMTYSGSPRISTLAEESGMSTHGKALFYSTNPELVDADTLQSHCPSEGQSIEYGCYLPSENRIYLLDISTPPYNKILPAVGAHEMLHVAWQKLSASKRAAVGSDLEKFMTASKDQSVESVKADLALYKEGTSNSSEAHSFIGTEIDTLTMPDELESHYKSFFSGRWLAVDSYKAYETGLIDIRTSLDKRAEEVSAEKQEIANYKAKWLDQIEYYMRQNAYYGDYVTYNKNVNAYNNNKDIYNKKVDAYNARLIALKADITFYNNQMNLLKPSAKRDISGLE